MDDRDYQYRNFHCKDKMVCRSFNLYNGNQYTWKDGVYIEKSPITCTCEWNALIQTTRSRVVIRRTTAHDAGWGARLPAPVVRTLALVVVARGLPRCKPRRQGTFHRTSGTSVLSRTPWIIFIPQAVEVDLKVSCLTRRWGWCIGVIYRSRLAYQWPVKVKLSMLQVLCWALW